MEKKSILNIVNKVERFWKSSDDVNSFCTKLVKEQKFGGIFTKVPGTDLFVVSFLVKALKDGEDIGQVYDEITNNLFSFLVIKILDTEPDIECSSCDGDGKYKCSSCDGIGDITCSKCEGDGRVVCSSCDGTGELEDGEPCDECQGDGEVDCDYCDGTGDIYCDRCSGSGEVECPSCDGDGFVYTKREAKVAEMQYVGYDIDDYNLLKNMEEWTKLDNEINLNSERKLSLIREDIGRIDSSSDFEDKDEYFMEVVLNEEKPIRITYTSYGKYPFSSYSLDSFI